LTYTWLEDHGGPGGNFRVDPSIHTVDGKQTRENIKHTTTWIHDRLDKPTFLTIWRMCEKVIDWDSNFADRSATPFYYLKQLVTNMVFNCADLVIAEKKLNPGVKWSNKLKRGE
jgi:hypothetical protein